MSLQVVDKQIGPTGYGLMGFNWNWSSTKPTTDEAIETMREALKQGANFWNGGVFYGTPDNNSLHLLQKYFEKYPDDAERVVISIKGGNDPKTLAPQADEVNLKKDIDFSLKMLGDKKKLDIFEASRVDPKVPIELTVGYIKEYVDAGRIGGVGLSEVSAESIRRAAKITKIASVEVEFSLWATDILENGIAKACADLNIPIVAYSPLGRGFLTGQIKNFDDIPEGDFRRTLPRFQPEVFDENLTLVREIERIANKKGCTAGQIGLSWVRQQSGRHGNPIIVPIPGTTSTKRLEENMTNIDLTEDDFKDIDAILSRARVTGDRYGGHAAAVMNG